MSETLEINGETFAGHRLYGPTYGEKINLELNSRNSASVAYRVLWSDLDRFGRAVLGESVPAGNRWVYTPPAPHPELTNLRAQKVSISPLSPAQEKSDGEYRWGVFVVEYAPIVYGFDQDRGDGSDDELNGYTEKWTGSAQLLERAFVKGAGTSTRIVRRLMPYPLVTLSLTSPRLPTNPIDRATLLFATVNEAEFRSPGGTRIPTEQLLYGTFSCESSTIAGQSQVVRPSWTITHELIWRPVTGWNQDYADETGAVTPIKTLDGTAFAYPKADFNTIYRP